MHSQLPHTDQPTSCYPPSTETGGVGEGNKISQCRPEATFNQTTCRPITTLCLPHITRNEESHSSLDTKSFRDYHVQTQPPHDWWPGFHKEQSVSAMFRQSGYEGEFDFETIDMAHALPKCSKDTISVEMLDLVGSEHFNRLIDQLKSESDFIELSQIKSIAFAIHYHTKQRQSLLNMQECLLLLPVYDLLMQETPCNTYDKLIIVNFLLISGAFDLGDLTNSKIQWDPHQYFTKLIDNIFLKLPKKKNSNSLCKVTQGFLSVFISVLRQITHKKMVLPESYPSIHLITQDLIIGYTNLLNSRQTCLRYKHEWAYMLIFYLGNLASHRALILTHEVQTAINKLVGHSIKRSDHDENHVDLQMRSRVIHALRLLFANGLSITVNIKELIYIILTSFLKGGIK